MEDNRYLEQAAALLDKAEGAQNEDEDETEKEESHDSEEAA